VLAGKYEIFKSSAHNSLLLEGLHQAGLWTFEIYARPTVKQSAKYSCSISSPPGFERLLWRNRLVILGKILESRIQQNPSAIISQKQTPKIHRSGSASVKACPTLANTSSEVIFGQLCSFKTRLVFTY
jgi:hypothetical protein